jgi:hypothetical protein
VKRDKLVTQSARISRSYLDGFILYKKTVLCHIYKLGSDSGIINVYTL